MNERKRYTRLLPDEERRARSTFSIFADVLVDVDLMRRGSGRRQGMQTNSCAYLVRACGPEELQLCEVPLRSYVSLGNHHVSVPPD